MLDGMSDSIQGSRIENLHSWEVDRQSPTGLIFVVIVTSAKEVIFSSVFVCQQNYAKITLPFFTKFGGKVARGPWKKPLEFGGNLDHVKLGLGLRQGYNYGQIGNCHTPHGRICVTWHLFNNNNFVRSAALVEICALYSLQLLRSALSLVAQCIVIGPVCNGLAACVCVFVGLLPR